MVCIEILETLLFLVASVRLALFIGIYFSILISYFDTNIKYIVLHTEIVLNVEAH